MSDQQDTQTIPVPREKVRAMLAEVAPDQQEALLQRMRERGYRVADAAPAADPQLTTMQAAGQALMAPWSEQAKAIGESIGQPAAGNAVGNVIQKGMDIATKTIPDAAASIPYAGKVLGPVTNFAADMIPQSPGGAIAAYAGGKAMEAAAPMVAGLPLVKSAEERLGEAGAAVIKRAKDLGIPMSISDITQSPGWAKIEAAMAKTPLGAGPMQEFRNKQLEAAKAALTGMADKFGNTQEVKTLGQNLKSAIASQSMEKNDKAKELYDAVEKLVPPETVVTTPSLQKAAQKLLAEHRLLKPSMQDGDVKAVLSDLAKDAGSSWQGLSAMRSKMMQEIADNDAGIKIGLKGQSNPVAGIYKRLMGPLEEDVAKFGEANGGKVNDAIQLARSYYGGFKGRFSSDAIKQIVDKNPEDIAGFVLRPNNLTEIAALKKAAGPESFREVKRAFMDKLLTAGKGGEFSPQAMDTMLSKYGDSTLKEIFSGPELKGLNDFRQIAKTMGTAEKMSGNPSGTAQNIVTMATGGLMVRHPVTGITVAIAPAALSRIMVSDAAREAVINGLKIPATSPGAAQKAGQIIGLLMGKQLQDRAKKAP